MCQVSANPASVIGIFFIIVFGIYPAFAQKTTSGFAGKSTSADESAASVQTADPEEFDRKNELSVRGGFAPKGLTNLRKSNFGFAAVRYSRRIAASDSIALKYTVDAVPVAVINYEKQLVTQTAPNNFSVQSVEETVYGFGLTPVGFQLNFRRRNKIQPFVAASAGLIIFSKTIPDDRTALFPDRKGTRLNFATGAGGGVEFVSDAERSYTLGYQFQHISNASRGSINPGFNHNLFYFGYTFNKW